MGLVIFHATLVMMNNKDKVIPTAPPTDEIYPRIPAPSKTLPPPPLTKRSKSLKKTEEAILTKTKSENVEIEPSGCVCFCWNESNPKKSENPKPLSQPVCTVKVCYIVSIMRLIMTFVLLGNLVNHITSGTCWGMYEGDTYMRNVPCSSEWMYKNKKLESWSFK